MNIPKMLIIYLTGLTLLIFSACSPDIQTTNPGNKMEETPVSEEPASETGKSIDTLLAELQKTGMEVEKTQAIEQPFFSIPGKIISVNGEDVQVYQYPDEKSRENESRLISSDGSVIGNNQIDWVDTTTIWASGNLIVIYIGSNSSVIGAINDSLGKPIASRSSPPASGSGTSEYPGAVLAAIKDLALRLSINESEISVVSYEEVTWPDSCLGLGKPNEVCLQVITPGYLIKLAALGSEYEYHTDQSGRNLKIADGPSIIEVKPNLDLDKPVSILAAMHYLSKAINTPISDIRIVSAEKVEWSDSCLGLPESGELCAEVIVPGWRIMLVAGAQLYELHTDLSGQLIRLK